MGEKIVAGKTVIKFKGPYDWGGLYKMSIKWLMGRKYTVHESRYKDKTNNPLGSEVEVKLYGTRKQDSYIRRRVDVEYHLWNHKDQIGMLHGKKQEFTNGRVTITIKSTIEIDWQGIFTGSKWKKIMGEFYYWIRKKEINLVTIDDHEYEALRLEYEMKKFLKMETDVHKY